MRDSVNGRRVTALLVAKGSLGGHANLIESLQVKSNLMMVALL